MKVATSLLILSQKSRPNWRLSSASCKFCPVKPKCSILNEPELVVVMTGPQVQSHDDASPQPIEEDTG
ncbi:hypothetical protein F0562_003574 [Nyssa sinensis]|uniref:Uncharacterized protein n=1 Tax=Nyssa sinensis TaxID=561372 RepID=A0A5J5BZ60_9ASTE|nr:hypothetical protein F0562_003574 [Nyssa sinensis]